MSKFIMIYKPLQYLWKYFIYAAGKYATIMEFLLILNCCKDATKHFSFLYKYLKKWNRNKMLRKQLL